MKCPACSVNLPDGSTDCPSCGVNFEKWNLRAARANLPPELREEAPVAPAGDSFLSDLPIGKIVMLLVLAGGVYGAHRACRTYMPGGLADMAKPTYKETAETKPAEPPPATVPEKKGPEVPMAGYDALYSQYNLLAESLGAPLAEEHLRRFFDMGVSEANGLGFDAMADVGMAVIEAPFDEGEKRLGDNIRAKCQGESGMEYLAGLPPDNSKHSACWQRMSGRAKSTAYVQVIHSPVFQFRKWAQVYWQPSGRWSAWTDGELAAAAELYADKHYGYSLISRETQAADKLAASSASREPGDLKYRVADCFKFRARREGYLAGAAMLRSRQLHAAALTPRK